MPGFDQNHLSFLPKRVVHKSNWCTHLMKNILFLVIMISLGVRCMAQSIEENFSSGSLDQWSGDLEDFVVENGELRLNASMEGQSAIRASFSKSDTLNWFFDFKLDFPPSNNNFLEVYLCAATDALETTDALFLRIGESGSDDNIQLYKRENESDSLIANSAPGTMSDNPAVRVKIQKKGTDWSLSYRPLDSISFTEFYRADLNDAFLPSLSFFGFNCNYTSTRRDRFYFDNIAVGAPMKDTVPPFVEQLTIPKADQIELRFSEALDTTGLGEQNVQLTPSMPGIKSISFKTPLELELLLNAPLISGADYQLSATDFVDLAGNSMRSYDTIFQIFYPDTAEAYDLVINEIMADPNPAVGLPEAEYLELFNRSDKTVNLKGYSLTSGSSSCELTDQILPPGAFVVVTDIEDASLFPFVDQLIGVDGFINLSNAGDDILLSNSKGGFVHFIAYRDSWYRNNERSNGGYSLEMINSDDPCREAQNWQASQSLSGGTPGFQNSISADTVFGFGPELLSVYPQSPDTILLRFDRRPGDHFSQLNKINISGVRINELASDPLSPLTLWLILDDLLIPQRTYTLTIASGFEDCTGRISESIQELPVQLPELPETGDLVINEILTDPIPGAEDYVEFYNRSNKVLTLESLAIRNKSNDQTVALDLEVLVFPGTYAVLTENINGVLDNFEVPNPQWIYRSELPSFNNDEGNVQIGFLNVFGLDLIDEMNYRPEMHYAFLDDLEGIGLEKLNPDWDGLMEDNWHSAAQSAGYGTPTGPNSQFTEASQGAGNSIELSADRISPDQDGFEDVLLINYKLDKPGYKADILIFNDRGQLIRSLGRDVLLSRSGQLKWDGLDENGTVPQLGIYIILVEALHPEGDVIEKKLPCVLAKKL